MSVLNTRYTPLQALLLYHGNNFLKQTIGKPANNRSLTNAAVGGTRVTHLYPSISTTFDFGSQAARENRQRNIPLFENALKLRERVINMGDTRPKHVSHDKLSVYDRIRLLQDPGTDVLFLSTGAGLGMPYGDINCGGVVSAIVTVEGELCVVNANDWTVKGGTSFPITVKKQIRAQEIAFQNSLPCIYVVDSGGGFLPLQADIFPDKNHGGRIFRNQAVLSSMGVPQIAVVCGPCTAGGAYVPTMSDEAVIVKGTGSLYLGGPPLVKAATGETIGVEELGGAYVHCSISGCTDYYAENESIAMATTRHIVASLNLSRSSVKRVEPKMPELANSMDVWSSLIPHTFNEKWPIAEILMCLCDGSRFHEFKEKFGVNLMCGYARINGYLVGILASNGVLDATAAVKGAHFIRLSSLRNIPLVFLQNTPSDELFLSATGSDGVTAKARGQMMSVLACSKVPKITVIMGGSYGPSGYAMCGRAMTPNFIFSWPNAAVGVASPEDTTKSLIEQGGASKDVRTSLIDRFKKEEEQFSNHLIDDGVILPHETRQVLSQCLDICTRYDGKSKDSNPLSALRM